MNITRYPITSREEWLAMRRKDVTASEVAALVCSELPDDEGHPYKTIYGMALEKRGYDIQSADYDSDAMRRGIELEPIVAKHVARLRKHWTITKANEYLRAPEHRIGATPDFYITDQNGRRGVLQTKSTNSYVFKRLWDNGGEELIPPLWISLQTLQEAMLAQADFAAVAVLVFDKWETHIAELTRHEGAEARILAEVKSFWDAVDNGREPQPNYARDGDLIAAMYPTAVEGKVIDLTKDNYIRELCETRELNAAIIKEAEARKKEAEAEIRHKLGDAEAAIVPGWKITCKTIHRKELIQKATSYRSLLTKREFA